ncbi:MAG: hypothetical protein J7K58_04560, partial [Euryarchaeota archaeon]|nr:hypothetical protein [Euryarchaeota archaeon]
AVLSCFCGSLIYRRDCVIVVASMEAPLQESANTPKGQLMKCPNCGLVEDRDFYRSLKPSDVECQESKRIEGFEGRTPNEGLMKANPYGIIVLEKQRLGLRFHEITLTTP